MDFYQKSKRLTTLFCSSSSHLHYCSRLSFRGAPFDLGGGYSFYVGREYFLINPLITAYKKVVILEGEDIFLQKFYCPPENQMVRPLTGGTLMDDSAKERASLLRNLSP